MPISLSSRDREVAAAILPRLPARIIDAHSHAWSPAKTGGPGHGRGSAWPALVAAKHTPADFAATLQLLFPGKTVTPLIFSSPSVKHDTDALNAEVAAWSRERAWPALALIRPEWPAARVAALLDAGSFLGLKPYPSFGPAGRGEELAIHEFLPDAHLAVADARGAVVMLHIARRRRLADPDNLAELLSIDQRFPQARVVVAHIGRAYVPGDAPPTAWAALGRSRNLLVDISANTCVEAMRRLIGTIGPARILYGSDLPITRMRMQRIERDGTYLNRVPAGLYGAVTGEPHMEEVAGAEAEGFTLFLYEEILAFLQAADAEGLSRAEVDAIFHDNAARMLGLPLLPLPHQEPS